MCKEEGESFDPSSFLYAGHTSMRPFTKSACQRIVISEENIDVYFGRPCNMQKREMPIQRCKGGVVQGGRRGHSTMCEYIGRTESFYVRGSLLNFSMRRIDRQV